MRQRVASTMPPVPIPPVPIPPVPIPPVTAPPATAPPVPTPTGALVTTEALVAAARERDPSAWAELVARFEGMVAAVVRSYRMPDTDRADTMQNTWLRALERLETLREPQCLGGWLATIARREALATLRRSRREQPVPTEAMVLVADAPDPEAAALAGDAGRAVTRAVAALPAGRRTFVYALFATPEPTYAEIAAALVMPVGSIGPTRQRVLGTLRTELVEAGYSTASMV